MKKLLYLSNLRLPTEKAYGIQIAKMCEAFAIQVEVKLIYPRRRNPIKADVFDYYSVEKNFKIKKLPAIDFYITGFLDRITVGIKSFISGATLAFYALFSDADVIYSRDELVIYMLSFFKKGLVFEAHRFSQKRKFFYKRFKNTSVKTVVISKAIEQELIKLGFGEKNILVAHDGVDLKEFNIEMSQEEARKKTDLPLGKKIVMYTGHLFEWKGADVLLEAARLVSNFEFITSKFGEILFIFVGGMEYDIRKFKEKVERLNNVLILGHKSHKEIPIYLKAADILVLPNSAKDTISGYTSPLKLFEYMASRRPVVASDLSSIREVINENIAVLVEPDSPKSLAEGIIKIINNKMLGEKLTQESFDDVQNHTWADRALKILDFV